MAESPKYLDSYDDVPVQIPDDYDQSEKKDAVELAEGLIELDLEEGDSLRTVTPIHKAAIKQRATCELAKGASDPDDTTIGDLQDDGTEKADYAHQSFCDHYNELVTKMRNFMEDDTGGVYVYSTSKSEDRKEWERFAEQIDIDFSDDFAREENPY